MKNGFFVWAIGFHGRSATSPINRNHTHHSTVDRKRIHRLRRTHQAELQSLAVGINLLVLVDTKADGVNALCSYLMCVCHAISVDEATASKYFSIGEPQPQSVFDLQRPRLSPCEICRRRAESSITSLKTCNNMVPHGGMGGLAVWVLSGYARLFEYKA